MEPRHRHSHHELVRAPDILLTDGEGGDLFPYVDKRRLSLDQTADQVVARSSETSDHAASRRNSNSAQVRPVESAPRRLSLKDKLRKKRRMDSLRVIFFKESFFDVYGYLGVVMLLAFFLSFLAMVYLTVVQVVPNYTANYLMNTDMLDNGDFLLMSRPPQTIVVTSALMLSIFACLYVWLIVFMMSYNDEDTVNNLAVAPDSTSLSNRLVRKCLPLIRWWQGQSSSTNTTATASRVSFDSFKGFSSKMRTASFGSNTASKLIFDFTSMEGTYHRYYDALLDFPKLIFQTMSLATYLSKGFPLAIIFFYVLPLGFNWLISFYRFQRSKPDPALIVARVFYLFDLFFAVFAPIMMLVYAYYNFHMDRDSFSTREETLTPGSFDRIARLFADPIEVEIVKTSFSNLQITDGQYILIKCFLNLLGIYKWKKVIAYLILANRSRRQENEAAKTHSHPRSKAHTIFGGIIFICCSLGIIVYTGLSLSTSIKNCAPYNECKVYSYQWQWGRNETCQCIVFIDREMAPRTYDEWINAKDVTESVRALAANGHLETVQIINRAMPELPEELRLCKGLKDLILIYTKMQRLPDWANEFTRLQYFHVENDFIHSSLEYLPPDLFSNMHSLRFLRTGGAAGLQVFPSLAGLDMLSTLVLSIVRGLEELPNLDDLTGLTTLYVADATHVHRLPSLMKLTSLKNFAVFRRSDICCNGWATGYCDLSNFQCLDRPNEPQVTCVADRIPREDLAKINHINGFLCGKNITQDVEVSEPTLESTDGICQGVLYRECYLNSTRGICYNGRMQVIHCDVFGEYEKMRRLQIARREGDKCDPEVEAWLGCK